MADDTVIIWSTDNGGQNGLGGNNWPLRGNKGGCFEGGVRGSGFVWGKRITGNRGGRLWRGLSHVVDWFATLVDGAGGEPPPGKDSISMWGALRSGGASPRTEALLQLAGPAEWAGKPWMDGVTEPDAAIRVGKWKLHPCLFDLDADPTESSDLSTENPEHVRQLLARLAFYNRTHQPDISDPTFDNASCPQPPEYVWMPWRK
eukprot:gene13319-37815_t